MPRRSYHAGLVSLIRESFRQACASRVANGLTAPSNLSYISANNSNLDLFGPVWTCLDLFGPVLENLFDPPPLCAR